MNKYELMKGKIENLLESPKYLIQRKNTEAFEKYIENS